MSDAPPKPSAQNGGVLKVGLGVTLLLVLNYVFNELMDDSGLHVLMLTASLADGANMMSHCHTMNDEGRTMTMRALALGQARHVEGHDRGLEEQGAEGA